MIQPSTDAIVQEVEYPHPTDTRVIDKLAAGWN